MHSTGARRMPDGVLLDHMRCDGQMYGGCEMECMIVWKDAWLEPVDDDEEAACRVDLLEEEALAIPEVLNLEPNGLKRRAEVFRELARGV